MSAEIIGIAIAAASAAASAVSAYASRQAVDRAHRAFVWPSISYAHEPDGRHIVRARLHNDGPGVAYDVRWSIGELKESGPDSNKWISDDELSKRHASSVVRAIRPGEALPPDDSQWLEQAYATPDDDIWWVLVRWTDGARIRWQLSEQGPSSLRMEPRRLRTWWWQLWRPRRDW